MELYFAALTARNMRPKTIRTYRGALQRLAPLLVQAKSGETLLGELAQLKPSTRALYLSTARSFEAWAAAGGYRKRPLLSDQVQVKLDETLPRPVPAAELSRLELQAAHAERRVRLLYLVLRWAGLRIESEALALLWSDVELTPGRESITVRRTKGRADRHVPIINAKLLAELRRQCPKVERRGECPVFSTLNRWGTRRTWSYRAALSAWAELCQKASVTATPHQLRHTLATQLGRKMNPFELRQFFGWRKLEQAARYCAPGNVRAALRVALDDDDSN
jgi:integrase